MVELETICFFIAFALAMFAGSLIEYKRRKYKTAAKKLAYYPKEIDGFIWKYNSHGSGHKEEKRLLRNEIISRIDEMKLLKEKYPEIKADIETLNERVNHLLSDS